MPLILMNLIVLCAPTNSLQQQLLLSLLLLFLLLDQSENLAKRHAPILLRLFLAHCASEVSLIIINSNSENSN